MARGRRVACVHHRWVHEHRDVAADTFSMKKTSGAVDGEREEISGWKREGRKT